MYAVLFTGVYNCWRYAYQTPSTMIEYEQYHCNIVFLDDENLEADDYDDINDTEAGNNIHL